MEINVFGPLSSLFESRPDEVWVECDDDNLSGKSILDSVANSQAALTQAGAQRGARVLIFSGRSSQFWIDTMAVWGLGMVSIPIDSEINENELEYIVSKSDPEYYIGGLRGACSRLKLVSCVGVEASSGFECKKMDKDSIASILFTSGSTGKPKGVMLSHSAISGNAYGTIASFEMLKVKKMFVPIPFRFVSSLSHFVASLYNSVCYAGTERRFLKTELLERLQATQIDGFGGSPMQLRWIAELASEYELNLSWLMASGDNLPVQTIDLLGLSLPGIRVVTAYGLTELGGRFCILPPSMTAQNAGSVGKPIPGLTLQILDDELKRLPVGESGEVYVNGDYVFSGYINDEKKTIAAISTNGFATGDVGYLDDQGLLYLSGRSDDIFKSGGLKVCIQPITAVLMDSGYFDDIAVISMPDELLGHVPAVYYVIKPAMKFNKGNLMRTLRKQLPPGHLPRIFTEIDRIPRTGSGKVQRGELKKLFDLSND